MIDGFKAILKDNLDSLRQNPLLDFVIPVSKNTGELKDKKFPVSEYKGLIFTDKKFCIEVRGSLHKFYNDGKHNYDDFDFAKIERAVYILFEQFGIDLNLARLTNLEIGINFSTEFATSHFLNSLINHRGKQFTFQKGRNKEYRECTHTQFFIKIYNKGLQYSLLKNVMRVEVKYRKMERPNYFGIRYLSDLLDVEKIKKLNDELLRIYDEILMGDITVSCQELNNRDQLLFTKGHNPAYWEQVLPNPDDFTSGSSSRDYLIARKKYERKLARFKFLLINTGASSHKEIVRSLMIEKSAKLLRCPSEKKTYIFKSTQKRGKLTKVLSDVNPNKFLKTDKKTGETDLPGLMKNQQLKRKSGNVKTREIDSLLYSVVSPHNGGEIKRICKVTKLDITMQKENSEFLCTTGIKYYKKNYPGIWLKLWQRLDTKWHGCSEETQIQEIHHSIRNQYFNKIHNTRRSIDRIVNEPALFSQLDLIRKDKLELAGLAS